METQTARKRPCVILVPVGGHIVPACEDALKELERRGYEVRRTRGYAAIDQGRNQMATDALRDGFEETMWIDSDIGFDPDAVDKLRASDVPIVCGIYAKKGKKEVACYVMPNTKKLTFGKKGGLTEILYAATGFLLVRRQAYETIQKELDLPVCNKRFGTPLIPFFQPMVVKNDTRFGTFNDDVDDYRYLAEDYSFSERARQCGINIYADTSIRLQHYGEYGYSWEDSGGGLIRYENYNFIVS